MLLWCIMSRKKLIIVAKGEIVGCGLKSKLEQVSGIQVVDVCSELGQDKQQFLKQNPDVMLICTNLIPCYRAEEVARFHYLALHTHVVALCDSNSCTECIHAIKAGARACLSKDMPFTELVKSIELVAYGEVIISSTMAEPILGEFRLLERVKGTAQLTNFDMLSKREGEVLNLVAQGLTNQEIADTLFISDQTVMVHMRNIMKKLHAHTREQAVAFIRAHDEQAFVQKV